MVAIFENNVIISAWMVFMFVIIEKFIATKNVLLGALGKIATIIANMCTIMFLFTFRLVVDCIYGTYLCACRTFGNLAISTYVALHHPIFICLLFHAGIVYSIHILSYAGQHSPASEFQAKKMKPVLNVDDLPVEDTHLHVTCMCGKGNMLFNCACDFARKIRSAFSMRSDKREARKQKHQSWVGKIPQFQSAAVYLDHIDKMIRLGMLIYMVSTESVMKRRFMIIYIYLSGLRIDITLDDVSDIFRSHVEFQACASPSLSDAQAFWKQVYHSDVLLKIKRLIAGILAIIMCSENPNFKFSADKLKFLGLDADLPSSASLIDCILDTASCVSEKAELFRQSGKLTDLFAKKDQYMELEAECAIFRASQTSVNLGIFANVPFQDGAEYHARLTKLITSLTYLQKGEYNRIQRLWVVGALTCMMEIRVKYLQMSKERGLRIAPYAVLIEGDSGVGKSSLSQIVMKQILAANDYSSTPENLTTLNLGEKHQTDYMPQHNGIFIDDINNTKAQYATVAPTSTLIDFINNVSRAAVKADVTEKGMVMLEPKAIVGTTNTLDIGASIYSNEPVSILRRFNMSVRVSVKPAYQKAVGNMLDPSLVNGSVPDVWDLKAYRVTGIKHGGKNVPKYTLVFSGGIHQFNALVCKDSNMHFKHQKRLMQANSALHEEPFCEHKVFRVSCAICPTEPAFQSRIHIQGWMWMLSAVHSLFNTPVLSRLGYSAFMASLRAKVVCILAWLPVAACFPGIGIPISLHMVLQFCGYAYVCRGGARVTQYLRYSSEWLCAHKKLMLFAVSFSVILGVLRSLRSLRSNFQSDVEDLPPDEIPKTNHWTSPVHIPIPTTHESRTTTYEDLKNILPSNTRSCISGKDSLKQHSNIFGLKNDVWVMNAHVWNQCSEVVGGERVLEMEVTRGDVALNCNTFKVKLFEGNVWVKPGTDLAFFRMVAFGSIKDMSRFMLPRSSLSMITGKAGILCYRSVSGLIETIYSAGVQCSPSYTVGSAHFSAALSYNIAGGKTFAGLCGAPLMLDTRDPCIVGIHFAGRADSTSGAAHSISTEDVELALAQLDATNTGVMFHSSGTMPMSLGNISYSLEDSHARSHINFMDPGTNFDSYGALSGAGRHFSSVVVPSCISACVESVMNLPNLHGPPRGMNRPIHFQRHLNNVGKITESLSHRLLSAALSDFRCHTRSIMDANPRALARVVPLSESATLSGIMGVWGVDALNLKTSAGFPINAAKRADIIEVEPATSEHNARSELSPRIKDEVERIRRSYLRGERAYMIFRANLKDEATKLTKDKVRVFAGAPLAFSYLIRKYFLTTIVFIQSHPTDFECAVGVNAHGPDWTKLMKYLETFGTNTGIAGDYKAYDTTCSATIMGSAYRILLDIIEGANEVHNKFSPEDMVIIRGLITDLSQPIYEHRGEMLGVVGSNASGHNLTVVINNLCNSLYMRYAYYGLAPNQTQPFKQNVALLCYGDDNKMSVKPGLSWFNHTSVAAYLQKIGVVYTMADKTSESVAYIPLHSASFLKRGAVWNEEVQQYFAPLDEESIIKSLHNWKKDCPLSDREHAGMQISNALTEFFYHGPDHYSMRRGQLKEVANQCGLVSHVTGGFPPYEGQMRIYRYKYLDGGS